LHFGCTSWVVVCGALLGGCSGDVGTTRPPHGETTGGATGTSGAGGSADTNGTTSTTNGSSTITSTSTGSTSGAGGTSDSTSGTAASGGSGGAGGATGATGTGGGASGSAGRGTGGAMIDAGRPDSNGAGGGAGGTNLVDAGAGCGKRGIASVLAISSAAADLAALSAPVPGVSWFYGWASAPSSQVGMSYVAAGVEFVPMVWGHPSELSDANLASKIRVGPGTKYVLGYNEPNFTAQSNLTPAQAAAGWPFLEKAADQLGLQIVSPALNFCGGGCNQTDPFVWMDQFLAACQSCRIDFVAFHSYACDSNWFLNTYMKQAVDKYYTNGSPPRKIWVTEFACADAAPAGGWTTAQVQSYMNTVIPWLEKEPAIFRYSWFGDTTGRPTGTYVTPSNALLAGAGQLTAVGTTYTSLAASTTCP
jgi:hypothetical protein